MARKELYSENQYEALKAENLDDVKRLVNMILHSDDKYVKYKEGVRIVTDLKDMLESSARLYSNRPAILQKDNHKSPYRARSYKELKKDVDAFGTALFNKDLRGHNIAVVGENSYEWGLSYLATVCGVGTCVPLDKELTEEEIENLIVDSESTAIAYTKKFQKMIENIYNNGKTKLRVFVNLDGKNVLPFEDSLENMVAYGNDLLEKGDNSFLEAQVLLEDIAVILYTSGTTGISKGVLLTHRNLVSQLFFPQTLIKITKEDRFFSVLPIHHTYEGTCGFLIPLYFGSSIAYCEGLKYIVPNLAEAKPTVFLVVPLLLENLYKKIWQNIRKEGKEKLFNKIIALNKKTRKIGLNIGKIFFKKIINLFGGRLEFIICGGAPLNPKILEFFENFGIIPIQGYGLTECSPITALNPREGRKVDSAGYIYPSVEAKIIDMDDTNVGEICVKGPHVMKGYYKSPEETKEVLNNGWFKTGDFGYIDNDNFIHITGRKKSVIITKNGKNVFPEEIEFKLLDSEFIEDVMVFSDENKKGDDIIISANIYPDKDAFIEKCGEDYKKEDIIRVFKKIVDEYNSNAAAFKVIKRILLRENEFEKTTSKKLKRFEDSNKLGEAI
ncbi:MAG: AMP-binding protein [Clostridiales Family XIII bacterium]|jgi:long-subunit acyl-CoA synthetase (AMP-forming)|nr:AMP-binding protein [Clostridiales Family XIII bacterium]